jgi:hypothetical protein
MKKYLIDANLPRKIKVWQTKAKKLFKLSL